MKVDSKNTQAKLGRLRKDAARDHRVAAVVGYTGQAAIFVHENRAMKLKGKPRPSGIGAYWGPRGRAGFLLDVAREIWPTVSRLVVDQVKRGVALAQAVYVGALRIQRESQKNVPVEHGNLRASAFTRKEGG